MNCRWIEKVISPSAKKSYALHPLLGQSKLLQLIMIDIMPLDDRVLNALEQNPHLTRRNLRFETEQGRVTLRGVVNSYFQKQMAQEAIKHVEGVAEIANELEVTWA